MAISKRKFTLEFKVLVDLRIHPRIAIPLDTPMRLFSNLRWYGVIAICL
jgi:hypothetical protein